MPNQPTAENVAELRYLPLSSNSACVAAVVSTYAFGSCLNVTLMPFAT